MLLAINDRIKGWLGAVIVVLIGLPFAFWGIQSYVGGAGARYVAKIGDREISTRELDLDVSRLRQQAARNNPDAVPEDDVLRQQALDRIINTSVLEAAAAEQGFQISDVTLSRRVQQLFERDGEFDAEQFRLVLASQGMTPQMFEQQYRSELRVNQLRDAIVNSAIVSDTDIRKMIELNQQKREITWLRLNIDKLVDDITVSEADIEDYYAANIRQFMTPEQVSIEYVEISADTMTDIVVSEAQIKARYDDYVRAEQQREERRASHILITAGDDPEQAKQKIAEIRARLDEGADFAELAREFSDDPGSAALGGDLDWIEHGQMVKPFEDALYRLDEGEVSDIVETEFGYHLLRLDGIRGVEVDSFDERRDAIMADLRQEAADSMIYDLSEMMANAAYENPDSLEPAAEAVEQTIKGSELFTLAEGTGIAADERVRAAAFSSSVLGRGENSDLIELAPGDVMVLRIKDHIEAAPVPLDEVRTTIEEAIRVTRGQEIAAGVADEIIAELEQGAAIEGVLREGVTNEGRHTLENRPQADFDSSFVSEVMSMPAPAEGKPTFRRLERPSGDVAVVVLHTVTVPDEIDESLVAMTRQQYRMTRAFEDFGALLEAYKEKAEISINRKVLDRE